MTAFLISLAILIGGYFLYSLIIDRIMGTSADAPVPATTMTDGVDFVPLPTWKVFLIQFLNIAGLGPIFGAIMGIMFGPAAFLWIALGTIFAGGVHDYLSGLISLRSGGSSLPEIIGTQLGRNIKRITVVFSVVLLLLVGAVFILTPADLLAGMTPGYLDSRFWVLAIFAYYLLATMLPIDKLIGNLYPIFGFALLFMAAGLLGVLLFGEAEIPVSFTDFSAASPSQAIFPMMFVSIACGAISGFHATQSPMMARCLKSEKLARPVFYGAMVAEGIVALIWAAAAVTFTGGYHELSEYMSTHSGAGALVNELSRSWLGTVGGVLAVLGVIAAPITTGDTALRSARLMIADFMNLDQQRIWKRMAVTAPIFVSVFLIMSIDFTVLWRYFAWSNQTLAVFTLWAVTWYLARTHKPYIISMLPAMFMTIVSVTYLMYAPRPEGLGLGLPIALTSAIAVCMCITALFSRFCRKTKKTVYAAS
ncbi:MAG: carbon starvation protein A [Muribaculaceae bacterium]|nr:carbon starvation protein A [Muribaculaceae bacterium]